MNSEYDKIEDLLIDLEDLVANSKGGGLFGGKGFDKDAALDLIDDIRNNLPIEIKQAQKICDTSDRIIEDANNKAKNIIKDAEAEAERLVSNHEITKSAREMAEELQENAKMYVREMKSGALAYAEDCLSRTQTAIQESLDQFIKQNRYTEDILHQEVEIIYGHVQELRNNE